MICEGVSGSAPICERLAYVYYTMFQPEHPQMKGGIL